MTIQRRLTLADKISTIINHVRTSAKHKGGRTTGRRDTAMGTIVAARTGSGLSFSYTADGNQLTIYYFKSEIEAINKLELNSEAADPANT